MGVSNRVHRGWSFLSVQVVVGLFCLVVAGCRLGSGAIVASPMSSAQQEQAILEIVPLGTPREEVVERLQEAGVEGNFGVSQSVFYCDLWKRPKGEWWHINVALLFDQSGRLYKTRPADAQTASVPESAGTAATPTETRRIPEMPSRGAGEDVDVSRARTDRRTPFASEGDGFSN